MLHQSGHIMLTDFDLSKGSSPPGRPGVVKSKSPNQVSCCILHYIQTLLTFYILSLLLSIPKVVYKVFVRIVLLVQKNILLLK